jgi:2-polyprenyl-3-methyl-5-hydroxy-6-metoxy-1,4-benzoquinol methylase
VSGSGASTAKIRFALGRERLTSAAAGRSDQPDDPMLVPQAPVALFVYNRPAQVERVLESLRRNNVPKLYIFSDGPKTSSDAPDVVKVREVIKGIGWIEPEIVDRDANCGIRESMRLGLDRVFVDEDRVIVVEDDVAVAPEFCAFMNVCLDHYRDSDRIAGVTGLRYPFDRDVFKGYPYDVFLSPRFSSWGWGTWKRWWETVDFSHDRVVRWLATASDEELAIAGSDIPAMVRHLADGGVEWGSTTADIYSLLHMIRHRQLFVWPTWNMIENLGFFEGTHVSSSVTQSWSLEREVKVDFDPGSLRLVDNLEPMVAARKALDEFLESSSVTFSRIAYSKFISDAARVVAREITPPVVLRVRRALRRRIQSARPRLLKAEDSSALPSTPDPGDYTTVGSTEVPVQKETYYLALNEYVEEGDRVLDVGCGLGYGLNLLSIRAGDVTGVDVDLKAIEYCELHVINKNPKVIALDHYQGYHLPYRDDEFDVVTCVDVIEHVERYDPFVDELLRVAKRWVVFGTPNRRAEFTNQDGTPKNYWHRREWSYEELDEILRRHASQIDWHFINGAWEGPFTISRTPTDSTQALVPALVPERRE